jgi:hypothetical protein
MEPRKLEKVVAHPDYYIDIELKLMRCTVATKDGIRLGWLLGADWTRGSGQHIVVLDGNDFPTRHDPQRVCLHELD